MAGARGVSVRPSSSALFPRRASSGSGKRRAYVATTEQIWALYDEVGDGYRLAVPACCWSLVSVAGRAVEIPVGRS
jgi:hypothetical protein